jgi:hypothetical protein
MQPILHAMHHVLMSPPKVASALCPFPLTMFLEHVFNVGSSCEGQYASILCQLL